MAPHSLFAASNMTSKGKSENSASLGSLAPIGSQKPFWPSVITAKPAICDHFKTGQRSRGQDMKLFYRAGAGSGKFCFGLP